MFFVGVFQEWNILEIEKGIINLWGIDINFIFIYIYKFICITFYFQSFKRELQIVRCLIFIVILYSMRYFVLCIEEEKEVQVSYVMILKIKLLFGRFRMLIEVDLVL